MVVSLLLIQSCIVWIDRLIPEQPLVILKNVLVHIPVNFNWVYPCQYSECWQLSNWETFLWLENIIILYLRAQFTATSSIFTIFYVLSHNLVYAYVSSNVYLRSWSYCQALEIALRKLLVDDKITACLKQICLLGVIWKVSNRKTLSGETFCFLAKCLLSIFKFDAFCFFFRPPGWSLTNFLGMYCCFPVIQLVNFVYVTPVR